MMPIKCLSQSLACSKLVKCFLKVIFRVGAETNTFDYVKLFPKTRMYLVRSYYVLNPTVGIVHCTKDRSISALTAFLWVFCVCSMPLIKKLKV